MTTNSFSGNYLIDQQVEITKDFLQNHQQNDYKNIENLQQYLNAKSELKIQARNTGSYQVILEQSLTTQDKPFLYEILIQNDQTIIKSSLSNLAPKRVIQLLKMIKSLFESHIKLGKGLDHCLSISLWLQWLVKLHLTVIVSNIQNLDLIVGIRKFLQKKIHQRSQLKSIRSHLLSEQTAREVQLLAKQTRKQNPKFDYIEEQKEHIEEEDLNQDQQMLEGDDLDEMEMDEEMADFFQDDF